MKELIVTAKTVEDAIEQAYAECARLGVAREEVSVEVLETPTRRLFFSSPAKVKAVYGQEEAPAPKEEIPAAPQPEKQAQPKKKAEKQAKAEEKAQPTPAQEKKPEKSEQETPASEAEQPAEGPKVDAAVAYFKAVAAGMGVENITVQPVRQNKNVILRVDGPDVGVLIGRRGETMEALGYLTSLAGNRLEGEYEKIGLDVAGYRSKREKDLAALARRVGARVQKTGRSHMFEPMNPYERRIIHSAISEMENLTSESTGEGADRRVVVRSTAPNALPDKPRAPRSGRGGRGGRGRGRGRGSRKETREPAPRPEPTGDTPIVPERPAASLDEAFDLPLYGKIEL